MLPAFLRTLLPFFCQTILVVYIKYNIISGVLPSIILSMRYNHLSGITLRLFLLLWTFLLNHTLIKVVSPLSQCLHLIVHILYLYLAQ